MVIFSLRFDAAGRLINPNTTQPAAGTKEWFAWCPPVTPSAPPLRRPPYRPPCAPCVTHLVAVPA